VQWRSAQPGGLEKFAAELIQEFSHQFGPACLQADTAPLTLDQREQIWSMISYDARTDLIPTKSWQTARDDDDMDFYLEGLYPAPAGSTEEKAFRAALCKISRTKFQDVSLEAAKDFLPHRLRCICVGEPKEKSYVCQADELSARQQE